MSNNREFWRNNVVFGLASIVIGVVNYAYHVVLAHVLGPGDYGDLTAFLNVAALLALPGAVVTLLYTRLGRRAATSRGEAMGLWAMGIGLWVGLWAGRQPIAAILHVNPRLMAVFALEVVPSLALAANTGIVQRARWFVWVGLLGVLNTGFRMLAALGAAFIHFGLMGVGWLEGIAAWLTWGVSRRLASRVAEIGEPSRANVVAGTAVVGTINVLMTVADGLISKSALPPVAAGWFNGLATIGHTVQVLANSFGTVMLTSIIAHPAHSHRFLWITAGIYAGLAALAEVVFWRAGPWVVAVILGPRFLAVVPWLPYYTLGMIAAGFLNIAMLYSVGQKQWVVMGTSAAGLVVWVYRLLPLTSVTGFVRVTTGTMGITLAATGVVLAWGAVRVRPKQPARG
ncbi:MAG: capsular biosynthesis protein [Thermaerobacter sp.]|nr:capsular biosynthesis protein [Thermaerobacter sp.]